MALRLVSMWVALSCRQVYSLRVYLPFMIIHLFECHCIYQGFPRWPSGTELACQCRKHKRGGFDPWVGMMPWRRAWQCTPLSLPGESQGQRSLPGYRPQGHKRVRHNRSNLAHMYLLSGNCYVLVTEILLLDFIPFLFWWWRSWNQVGLCGTPRLGDLSVPHFL